MKRAEKRKLPLLLAGGLFVVMFLCMAPAPARADVSTKDPSSTPAGTWTTPTNAYASNNTYASTATGGATQQYGTYEFSLPSNATITKVEVGFEAYTAGDEKIDITCSWDGGTTWAPEYTSATLGTSDPNTVTWVDFTTATSWTSNKLTNANFRTRAKNVKVAGPSNVYLDWIPARVTYTLPAFDFSISASATSLVVQRGNSVSTTVTVTLVSGTAETVSLTGAWIGTAPGGVTPGFSPSSGAPTFDSTLSFSTMATASTGTFTYRVTGTGGSLERTVDVVLSISEGVPFDFSVTASPDNLTLARSDTQTSTISVAVVSGTAETVSLSGAWVGSAPTGISTGFSPTSGIPPFNSTLTLTTTSTAGAGTFTYRVTGQAGGLTRTDDITVTISTKLTLTLTTDNDNYEKGQTIQISGTVKNRSGYPVTSGTATIQLSFEGGSRSLTAQITNGSYSDNYQISFGDSDGTWIVTVTAADGLGNSGTENKSITVITPPGTAYYAVAFLSPSEGLPYSRGTKLTISIRLTEGGANVGGASVNFITPTGERIPLNEIPGTGTYSTTYTLEWDTPTGGWSISVEGTKTVAGVFKAGGTNIGVQVTPASLQITLLSPTKDRVEVGESMEIRVEVLYELTKEPVENAIITVSTPAGENLTLSKVAAGVYSKTYTPTSEDVGIWRIDVAAADLGGNSGTKASVVEVVPMGAIGILAAYWWAVLSAILAVGLASAYMARRTMLVRKLERVQKEKREIPRLKKEAARRYYTEGTLKRETYDELIKKYDTMLEELKRGERELRPKVKKIRGKKAK